MKHAYLIGKGIAHSKSPVMYNALFKHLGLDWVYEARDCASAEVAQAVFSDPDWLFLNATMPYKPLAFEAATVLAASVQLTGGANMLFRRAGEIVGLNTDGVGCIRNIQRRGFSFEGARVVVCGTGPTALAIFGAAAAAGAKRLTLLSRDRGNAQQVLTRYLSTFKHLAYATVELEPAPGDVRSFRASYEEPDFLFGSYTTSTQEIAAADVVLDATPLGMNEGDPLPFDEGLLANQKLVFDVVYGHGESKLLRAAQAAGAAVVGGQGMLVGQAVENARALLGAQDVPSTLSWDDMFALMADAAGFAC